MTPDLDTTEEEEKDRGEDQWEIKIKEKRRRQIKGNVKHVRYPFSLLSSVLPSFLPSSVLDIFPSLHLISPSIDS